MSVLHYTVQDNCETPFFGNVHCSI